MNEVNPDLIADPIVREIVRKLLQRIEALEDSQLERKEFPADHPHAEDPF